METRYPANAPSERRSCGAYQGSSLSDRIFFRKDWDHLALAGNSEGGVTLPFRLRASEASE